MTLGELFELLSNNPMIILFYFIALPLTAWLAGIFGEKEGHLSPWKYLYCGLIYLACVPGIFAVTLDVYQFLFERRSIYDTDIYTQILPIVSMIATLLLIRTNVDLNDIPGFDRIGGLIMIIFGILVMMWILDRTRILAITFLPFYYVIIILVVLLVAIRLGWSRMFPKEA